MTQFIVRAKQDDQTVHERAIRIFRLLGDNETKDLYIDLLLPRRAFNQIEVLFWNADGDKPVAVDNLKVERFE
jgi:hypothetical protein